jgi:biotin carboxyl carrier protein
MKFNLENTDETLEGEIIKALGNNEFVLKIKGKERNLKILNLSHEKIEFMLDNGYHVAKYLENTTSKITIVIDGVKVTFGKRPDLEKGDVVCVLESMKMQVSIKAHKDGMIKTLKIKQGASVAKNDVLAEIE